MEGSSHTECIERADNAALSAKGVLIQFVLLVAVHHGADRPVPSQP